MATNEILSAYVLRLCGLILLWDSCLWEQVLSPTYLQAFGNLLLILGHLAMSWCMRGA